LLNLLTYLLYLLTLLTLLTYFIYLPYLRALLNYFTYLRYLLAYSLTYFTYFIYLLTCLPTCLLTHLLTPWSRVLPEKLTGLQLFKKFSTFYGTRKFITAFTSARELSLSWASSIQSIPPHPTFWKSISILSSHLRLGLLSGLFLSGFLSKPLYYIFLPIVIN
jgi:hypothetical protein